MAQHHFEKDIRGAGGRYQSDVARGPAALCCRRWGPCRIRRVVSAILARAPLRYLVSSFVGRHKLRRKSTKRTRCNSRQLHSCPRMLQPPAADAVRQFKLKLGETGRRPFDPSMPAMFYHRSATEFPDCKMFDQILHVRGKYSVFGAAHLCPMSLPFPRFNESHHRSGSGLATGEEPTTMRTSSLQHRHGPPWLRFAARQRRSSMAISCPQPAGVKPGTISNLATSSPIRDPSTGEKATVTAA